MTARSSAAVLHALTLRIRSRSFNDMVDSLISDCIFKATKVYDTYDMTFNLFCAFVFVCYHLLFQIIQQYQFACKNNTLRDFHNRRHFHG